MDLTSPFPDLTTSFNNVPNFWDFDPLTGLSTNTGNTTTNTSPSPNPTNNNTFFDPMSSYFVPFNVAPPLFPHDNSTSDPVAAAAAAAAFAHVPHPEPYGFTLGAGTPVDLDLLHGTSAGGHDAVLE